MRGLTIFILTCFVFALGCSAKDDDNNGTSNNGTSNNGHYGTGNNKSNNGTANSKSNNITNGNPNNGQTTATNNGTTTATNNGTLPSVSVNCAEAELTDCFSNFDCQQTEVCTNVSDNATEIACCVSGTRGVKVLGDDCTDDDDTTCDSGICIGSNDSVKSYCSAPCGLDSECPEFMRCVPALGICAEGTRD